MKLLSQYVDYFEELRYRLLLCAVVWLCFFISAFYLADTLYSTMLAWSRQYQTTPTPLVVLSVWDGLQASINLAGYAAFFMSVPCVLFHTYQFIAPALYSVEKTMLCGWLCVCTLLFYLGAYMSWCYLLPLVMYALPLWLPTDALWLLEIQGYVRIVGMLLLYGGLVIQLPMVFLGLAYVGWLRYTLLKTARPYVWLGVFVVAMLITPPDMFMQLALALPLCLLYECCAFSIWAVQAISSNTVLIEQKHHG